MVDNITDSMDMNLSKLLETMKNRGAWHTAFHGVTKSQLIGKDPDAGKD